jgi:SUN domain-containing protein 1/2
LDEVERLIVAALRRYDADKTGRVDYALESAGGQVCMNLLDYLHALSPSQIVSTRCTRTYSPRTRRESVYGIPLWYSNVSPRSVIQRKSQSIIPGECWSFEGAVGHLLVGLAGTIRMTAVTYEHIPLTMSPDGHLDSAPKLFQLWVCFQ